jgi:hypothetical protein
MQEKSHMSKKGQAIRNAISEETLIANQPRHRRRKYMRRHVRRRSLWIPPEMRRIADPMEILRHPTYRRYKAILEDYTVKELKIVALVREDQINERYGMIDNGVQQAIKKMRKDELVTWMI